MVVVNTYTPQPSVHTGEIGFSPVDIAEYDNLNVLSSIYNDYNWSLVYTCIIKDDDPLFHFSMYNDGYGLYDVHVLQK